MPIYQLTFFFKAGEGGWSENYFCSAASGTAAATLFNSLRDMRLPLLSPDVSLVGGRISDVNVKGDSYPTTTAFPTPGTYPTPAGATSAVGQNCIRVLFNAGPLIRANRFFHGIPADQYAATKYTPTVAFKDALDSFTTFIGTGFGAKTKIPGAVAPPFYTLTSYSGWGDEGGDFKKIGRPFGAPVGRRLIA